MASGHTHSAVLSQSSICSPRPAAINNHLLTNYSVGATLDKGLLHKTKLTSLLTLNVLLNWDPQTRLPGKERQRIIKEGVTQWLFGEKIASGQYFVP